MLVGPGCDKPSQPDTRGPAATAEAAPTAPPSVNAAIALLYPVGSGAGQKLSLLGTGELSVGTQRKQIVFVAASAAASTPVDNLNVSAVVFAPSGGRWWPELVQQHIGTVADMRMTDDPVVIRRIGIGPASAAFLVPDGGSNQGITVNGVHVFAYENGHFADFGFVKTGEENGGNCADDEGGKALGRTPCWEYSGNIVVRPGLTPGRYDLIIKRQGTQFAKGAVAPVKDIVCTFTGRQYACSDS
jgi:hypothetical protein